MPVVARRARRSSSVGVMREGDAPGRSRCVGWGSKVTAMERALRVRALSTTRAKQETMAEVDTVIVADARDGAAVIGGQLAGS